MLNGCVARVPSRVCAVCTVLYTVHLNPGGLLYLVLLTHAVRVCDSGPVPCFSVLLSRVLLYCFACWGLLPKCREDLDNVKPQMQNRPRHIRSPRN